MEGHVIICLKGGERVSNNPPAPPVLPPQLLLGPILAWLKAAPGAISALAFCPVSHRGLGRAQDPLQGLVGECGSPMPRAEHGGDRQPCPGALPSPLWGGWETQRTAGAAAPGDHRGLGAGPLLKLPASLSGTYSSTPHPSESPCLSHPDGAGAAPHWAPASWRPWNRADETSCAPAPRARGAGRGYSRIKRAAATSPAPAAGAAEPRGRVLAGPRGLHNGSPVGSQNSWLQLLGTWCPPQGPGTGVELGCRVRVTGGWSSHLPPLLRQPGQTDPAVLAAASRSRG